MIRIISVIFLSLMTVNTTAHAGLWDDITGAITVHESDIKDRTFVDDVMVEGNTVASSTFRMDDAGRDRAHWADGSVSAVVSEGKLFIQLGEDFKAGLAPDLYIYIANKKAVDEDSFWAGEPIEISKLAKGSGASAYEIPQSVMYNPHVEVIIWCKQFGEFMGATTLIGGK